MRSRRSSARPRSGLRVGAVAVVLSIWLSGCYTQMARDHQAASPDTRPYFCNAVGDGTPPGGHGNGNHVHPIYQGMTKGPLSWADCLVLSNQMDVALAAVQGLETRAASEAAGWRELAEYIPGLGTHHSKEFFLPGSETPPFDPAKPQFLVYGGTGPDAPLVGLSYAASGRDGNPPEAFAGTNDWWHLHKKICMGSGRKILAGAEEIPDEECAALGGRQISLGEGIWLLHLWIMPDYQLKFDVFVSGHPCLGETAPLPREDACWEEIANHDPADGPLPGGGHGDHGEHGGHDQHDP
jgi:hypothetical protein